MKLTLHCDLSSKEKDAQPEAFLVEVPENCSNKVFVGDKQIPLNTAYGVKTCFSILPSQTKDIRVTKQQSRSVLKFQENEVTREEYNQFLNQAKKRFEIQETENSEGDAVYFSTSGSLAEYNTYIGENFKTDYIREDAEEEFEIVYNIAKNINGYTAPFHNASGLPEVCHYQFFVKRYVEEVWRPKIVALLTKAEYYIKSEYSKDGSLDIYFDKNGGSLIHIEQKFQTYTIGDEDKVRKSQEDIDKIFDKKYKELEVKLFPPNPSVFFNYYPKLQEIYSKFCMLDVKQVSSAKYRYACKEMGELLEELLKECQKQKQ